MGIEGISEKARNFIFQNIDSVELIEALLLFQSSPEKTWTADSLAAELRSNSGSLKNRIAALVRLQLVTEDPATPNGFKYDFRDPNLTLIVQELSQAYRIHRHSILEIIFSPTKKAKDFADAFKVRVHKKNEGDENG